MAEWDEILKELADDPDEYEQQAGEVMLIRQGKEYIFSMKEIPGQGLSVAADMDPDPSQEWIPISSYIQKNILGLPRLASQITRTIEKSNETRPGKFIEGPAECEVGSENTHWEEASTQFRQFLMEPEPGTTRIIELMAPAGQGKTVLLENAAFEFGKQYQPNPYPTPILLTVDLLGRYIGTIDDAIAGSLNNTFLFAGLTQKDVALCIRNRWLLLALDGFDELVARVGVRDAFLRINELLDQLRESGTVILSARESFFELYQISAAIRSYLQPKKGSYSTSLIKLQTWDKKQGIDVFRGLESAHPEDDLVSLLTTFDFEEEIVLHPFFLTRLADLWMKGERFERAGGQSDNLGRTKYVIETFVQRESGEKWIDREGNPLLPPSAHANLLGGIAEEMWRSGAFSLDAEELRVAGSIGLASLDLSSSQLDQIQDRIPTHAALMSRDRGFSFLHDRFFHFFLGHRIAYLLNEEDIYSVKQIMVSRDMGPSIVQWIVWNWAREENDTRKAIGFLDKVNSENGDETTSTNLAHLCAQLLNDHQPEQEIELHSHIFSGEALTKGQYQLINFHECKFWYIDLSDTYFRNCKFFNCTFGDLNINDNTIMENIHFSDCTFSSIHLPKKSAIYAPEDIDQLLQSYGSTLKDTKSKFEIPEKKNHPSEEAIQCVERFVKISEKTCDVPVEEIEETCGRITKSIVRIGLSRGIIKEMNKGASGPKRRFIRFAVDREKLLRGQIERTRDPVIDRFWDELRNKHPGRN